jgi:hypothetical protein
MPPRSGAAAEFPAGTSPAATSPLGTFPRSKVSHDHRDMKRAPGASRTFSDVCRPHLRAYMESLTRSIEEWERAEHNGALAAKDSVRHSPQHVLSPAAGAPDRARPAAR